MNGDQTMVYGNLALKAPASRECTLTVIPGGKVAHSVRRTAHAEPAFAARTIASEAPRSSSLASIARALIGITALVAVAAMLIIGTQSARATAYESTVAAAQRIAVTVMPGDSLWSIAAGHPVEGLTTAESAELIRSWNDLSSATLQPGMELTVPFSAQ